MMQHSDNKNEKATSFVPSDDDLIGYLLGSSSAAVRLEIEAWLAADAGHGDRLGQFASVMLAMSEAAFATNGGDETSHLARELVVSDRRASQFNLRFVIGLLTLAATISIVVFSIRGFRPDGLSDGRVAIVWADSLTTGTDLESNTSTPDWLLEDGLANDTSDDSASGDLADNHNESELSADDLAAGETLIGFSSDEPPEWMLAALAGMQSSGTFDDTYEVQP